ncbi:MAG: hypothetical protein GDA44_06820 [Prochloron sp. SP5CPC1]|nr:hypothetical protein [Candidatus Paraprochloron terpiosi SP5CPC1]
MSVSRHSLQKPKQEKVKKLPAWKSKLPTGLRALLFLKRSVSVFLFLSIAATVIVYSRKEYVEGEWSKSYGELEALLRDERELIATNEALKNQLADLAEKPETGLVPITPKTTIFLDPAQERPLKESQTKTFRGTLGEKTPLGY